MESDVQLLQLSQQKVQDVSVKDLLDACTLFDAGFHGVADAQTGASCPPSAAKASHAPLVLLTYSLVGPIVQSALLMVDTAGYSTKQV